MRVDASVETGLEPASVPLAVPVRATGRRHLLGLGLLGAVALVLPLGVGLYGVRLATNVFMFVALAQAWNLVGGYAGLMSIAHPAFFGTGALAAAVLLLNGFSLPAAVGIASILSVGIALVTGLPTLRLRGHYFVIASLLVAEAVRNAVLNLNAFGFSGGVAVNVVPYVPRLTGVEPATLSYFMMLILALGTTVVIIAADSSRWGYALKAMRDNEFAAQALGIDTTRLRLAAFLTSAVLTSLTGTAWALTLGVVDTNEAYSLAMTFEVIVMVFLGGTGTVWGPVLGVVVIQLVNEYFGIEFAELTLITSGLIVILIVLFLPEGLTRILTIGPRALAPAALKRNVRRFMIH